ncbi:MAG: NAD-dependent succinate-semialdehyde dehydrogenase [Micrococcaceae bacterium]
MRPYSSLNPATGEHYGDFPVLPDEAVTQALTDADSGYRQWKDLPAAQRAEILHRAAELFRERNENLANIATEEMGKTLTESRGEVNLVASIFDYYATQGPLQIARKELSPASGDQAWVELAPIGVLLGIMPWNYPYYQIARFAAPNLVLGNALLLKHARNCPRSAEAFAKVLHDAGVPENVYLNLFIDSSQVESVLEDDRVQGVSLTGSEQAGASVGSIAGRLMKKMVLELGGSDPLLVLEDADIGEAVKSAVVGRMANAGQACTASKRIIVVDAVYDEFLERFAASVRELKVGDPKEAGIQMGPLSSTGAVAEVQELVDNAITQGATALVGGRPMAGVGSFYEPTVLTGVTTAMRAHQEELFGPVAVVYRVPDTEAAIELANDSPFGLGAAVFTADEELAESVSARLETGMVTLNGSSKSQADLPFGGVKRSGVGRELGQYGLEEFANRKLIRRPSAAR